MDAAVERLRYTPKEDRSCVSLTAYVVELQEDYKLAAHFIYITAMRTGLKLNVVRAINATVVSVFDARC